MLPNILLGLAFGLKLVMAQFTSTPGDPCGLDSPACSPDTHCVPDSEDCTDTIKCPGTCQFTNTYPTCGGHTPNPGLCDADSYCGDDPRVPKSCGLSCDVPGICIPNNPSFCGGFAGFACPDGLFCYDEPDDGCDPQDGGADCGGICL